jgi:hypothetical protein
MCDMHVLDTRVNGVLGPQIYIPNIASEFPTAGRFPGPCDSCLSSQPLFKLVKQVWGIELWTMNRVSYRAGSEPLID